MYIAVDFDGTCVLTHTFPTGFVNIGAGPALRLIQKSHHLFMWTLRGNKNTDYLHRNHPKDLLYYVKEWAMVNGIKFEKYNESPTDMTWTDSHKQHADMFIDDYALNAPTMQVAFKGEIYNVIDWCLVLQLLAAKQCLYCTSKEYNDTLSQILAERELFNINVLK